MEHDPARGALFVVATPIGNLKDMSARAIDTLNACDCIVAEDTRRTRTLLAHFGVTGKALESLHAHSDEHALTRLVERLLRGEKVSLVTDAGTPAVSDPGEALVRAAIRIGAQVIPIPGPSAVLAAVVASGLSGRGTFRFFGFLPRENSPRREAIARLCATPEVAIVFESPTRTRSTLAELAAIMPERSACIARELTKVHEEFVRGKLDELAALNREWLGEVVIVLGEHDPDDRLEKIDDAAIDIRIDAELAKGRHTKAIAEELAAWSGRPRRLLYERVTARKAMRSE